MYQQEYTHMKTVKQIHQHYLYQICPDSLAEELKENLFSATFW